MNEGRAAPRAADLASRVPSPFAELLRGSLAGGKPPPERRIFVNRNLRMESIEFVGFDLDWTLAAYDRDELDRLTFSLTLDRLVDEHGYPAEVRRCELRPEFFARGLLIDKQAGTVLKMNRHRYVGQAFHGRERLEKAELTRLYRNEPLRPSSDRFYHVDSLFELPEVNLYTEIVELQRAGVLPERSYEQIYKDVRRALDWVHAEGDLKARVVAEPERFLDRSPGLALALRRLALGGRRLILLTNSDWAYARAILDHLLSGVLPDLDDWRQLFDLCLVDARKPRFFRYPSPFVPLDEAGRPGDPVDVPEWHGVYRGGSLGNLMRLLDVPGERVLYVGDHIYGDVVRSKLESTWRTALVVQELEAELAVRARFAPELARMHELKGRISTLGHDMDHLRDARKLVAAARESGAEVPEPPVRDLEERLQETSRRHHRARRELSELMDRVESAHDSLWGSLFKQHSSKTLFASQLEAFACIYTARVENFAFYGTNHYFRVLEDPMVHEGEGEG